MTDTQQGMGFRTPSATAETDGTLTLIRSGSTDADLYRESILLARKYPRQEKAVVQHLLDVLDAFPQFAEKALYSIKFGDGRAEGLTIRAAETIAAAWGNLVVRAEILAEDENGWDLQAGIFDLQTNYRWMEPARASKWIKRRTGQMELLDDRRQIMARNAAVSKATRNCILRVLPMYVKAAFELRVREKMAGGDLHKPADKQRVAACVAAFGAIGVTEAALVEYVEKPRDLWLGADLADLRATYNSIQEGESTVAEVFGSLPVAAPATPQGRVVDVQEGALSPEEKGHGAPNAPVQPIATPAEPIATPPPQKAPPTEETDVQRLRRQLAEAEAAEAKPAAEPVKPAEKPKAKAKPTAEETPQTPPAASASAAPPASAPTDDAALVAAVEACQTITDVDKLLQAMYAPGGALAGVSREKKRAVLERVQARRDAIVKASGQ